MRERVGAAPSLHQDERAPPARGQVLHLTVPVGQPRGVETRGQHGEVRLQGCGGRQGRCGGADVQVGVQELGCGGHRGDPRLEEVGRQQRAGPQPQLLLESRHEEGAVAGGQEQRGRGQVGSLLAAGQGRWVVL